MMLVAVDLASSSGIGVMEKSYRLHDGCVAWNWGVKVTLHNRIVTSGL